MRVAHKLSAWGVPADVTAVASHPAAARLPFSSLIFSFLWPGISRVTVVIDTVVVLTQHGQVRGFRVSTMFVGVDVVDLASIGRYGAVRPRTHQVFRHGQGAQLLGCEACFVEVDRAGGGVEKPDVELVTQ